MTFTVSSRVQVKGKNVVISKTVDQKESLSAIRDVGEQARQLRKTLDVQKKSTRQGYRKKKADNNA